MHVIFAAHYLFFWFSFAAFEPESFEFLGLSQSNSGSWKGDFTSEIVLLTDGLPNRVLKSKEVFPGVFRNRGRYLGTIGHFGVFSFHYTKNIISAEGGVLMVNEKAIVDRAHIVSEKGTDRINFLAGKVDKYSWKDMGSSFSMNEVSCGILLAQLEQSVELTARRLLVSKIYYELLQPLEQARLLHRGPPMHKVNDGRWTERGGRGKWTTRFSSKTLFFIPWTREAQSQHGACGTSKVGTGTKRATHSQI